MRLRGQVLGLCVALCGGGPAAAAGGAHIVDDAGVETPGACHGEAWLTAYSDDGRSLGNLSAGCTPKRFTRLELGATLQYVRDHPDAATVGPAFKLNLIPNDRTAGLALTGAAAWSLRGRGAAAGSADGGVATAALIAPLSWTFGYLTQVNVNAGWTYDRAARRRNDALFGAQVNRAVADHVSVMAEVIGHAHLRPGAQVGLRWNPGGGALDLDLLAGRAIDGTASSALTLGVTVRR